MSAWIMLSVTIITSAGSPDSRASFIAPTAPKCPSRDAPVRAVKPACSALAKPWTAPAQSSFSRLSVFPLSTSVFPSSITRLRGV